MNPCYDIFDALRAKLVAFRTCQVSIPDGSTAPPSMMSARFDGGPVELLFREVHDILLEHNFKNLMVSADVDDDGESALEHLSQIENEDGVILAICTATYGEKTAYKYTSHFELQYAWDNNLNVLPLRVEEAFPPAPPCGPRHPFDKRYAARVLLNAMFKKCKVYLDCRNLSAPEIAAMIATRLLKAKP